MAFVVERLNQHGLAYLHLVEPRVEGSRDTEDGAGVDWSLGSPRWRQLWRGPLIGAGGYTRRGAEAALRKGDVDLVAFGRLFISNPDLPLRFAAAFAAEAEQAAQAAAKGKADGDGGDDVDKAFLTPYDRSTFYGGDARGYVDYKTLEEEQEGRAVEN